ncbi:cell division control protein [Thecamonas trahens ATCC 50062]|uniref:Cell division control protein n=1 Tax=Thecamonas trahens ATCC 50062 TaxID=461836 RepID=A0A0L0DC14_THETB|nr:cell division control protein [Thecamonas trahens ATCC 50062]KNC49780.1 cell division control protein [Thecamonas trahens ATCC 50062]|eukprot:XP_013757564.1 cell division control protein [Thecamonas trahens ATCC 50062]
MGKDKRKGSLDTKPMAMPAKNPALARVGRKTRSNSSPHILAAKAVRDKQMTKQRKKKRRTGPPKTTLEKYRRNVVELIEQQETKVSLPDVLGISNLLARQQRRLSGASREAGRSMGTLPTLKSVAEVSSGPSSAPRDAGIVSAPTLNASVHSTAASYGKAKAQAEVTSKPDAGSSSSSLSSSGASSDSSSSNLVKDKTKAKAKTATAAAATPAASAQAPAVTDASAADGASTAGAAGKRLDSSSSSGSASDSSSSSSSGSSSSYYGYSSSSEAVVQLARPKSLVELIAETESPFGVPDSESNIVVDAEAASTSGCSVKAGTLSKLVERLASAGQSDMQYGQAFLMTYRSFMTPFQLLELLMLRWFTPPPPELQTEAELEEHATKVQKPIRLRILKLLKNWLDQYTYDFKADDGALVRQLLKFVEEATEGTGMAAFAAQLRNSATKKLLKLSDHGSGTMAVFDQKPPTVIMPKQLHPAQYTFLKLSPVELARQLTIMEFDLYRRIKPWEFLNQGWTKKDVTPLPSPHIVALTNHFNHVAEWVAMEVLQAGSLKKRAKTLVRIIDMASELRALNNFNGVMEILAGLQTTAVYRLRATWSSIPDAAFDTFESLKTLLSREKNFKNMRDALPTLNPPIIPYVGMWLTDLTFLEDGNQDVTPSGLINFEKRFMISAVIRDVQQYQQTPYCLRRNRPIRRWIASQPSNMLYSEDSAYELSLEVEPREGAPKSKSKSKSKKKAAKKKKSRSLFATLRRKKKKTVTVIDDNGNQVALDGAHQAETPDQP